MVPPKHIHMHMRSKQPRRNGNRIGSACNPRVSTSAHTHTGRHTGHHTHTMRRTPHLVKHASGVPDCGLEPCAQDGLLEPNLNRLPTSGMQGRGETRQQQGSTHQGFMCMQRAGADGERTTKGRRQQAHDAGVVCGVCRVSCGWDWGSAGFARAV